MEAIGAAASIVTLAGLALKATQTLCQTLSNFKNATFQATRISAAIRTLDDLLKQLQNSRITKDGGAHTEGLKTLLFDYNKNVQEYMKDLRRIQTKSTDTWTKRASKKLRIAYLHDRELLRILAEITQQCAALGTQLELIDCETTLEIREGVQHIIGSIETQVDNNKNHLRRAHQEMARLGNIDNNIERLVTTAQTVKTSSSNLDRSVAEIVLKMDKLTEVSHRQGDDILTLLLALQAQMGGANSQASNHITSMGISSEPALNDQSNLLEALDRLQSTLPQQQGAVTNAEADALITNLESILHTVGTLANDQYTTPIRSTCPSHVSTLDICDVKRLCKVISAAHKVNINPQSLPTLPMTGSPSQRRKRKDVAIQGTKLVISITERRFHEQFLSRNVTGVEPIVDTIAKLHIELATAQPCTTITAYFHHRTTQDGLESLAPTIMSGNTVPDDSAIFQAVSCGDIRRVQYLVEGGQYTLRDRNSNGTPLIHFAMTVPAMCRFLVENGADVDELSWDRFRKDRYCPPLSQYTYDHSIGAELLEAIIECRKIILRAGADPTLHSGDRKNEFERAVSYCTFNSMKAIIDCDQGFINLEQRFEGGQTALFRSALYDSVGHEASKVQLLLDRGADINARDDEGYTCLHVVLNAAILPRKFKRDIALLTLLIERGSDIFSTANNGRSIFEDAYKLERRIAGGWFTTGSYRADLWDCALVRTGHDHLARRVDQRRFCYTEQYTRESFEAMWNGMEETCPYFEQNSSTSQHPGMSWGYENGDRIVWRKY